MARRGLMPRLFSSHHIERRMQSLTVSRRVLAAVSIPIAALSLWTAGIQAPNNVLELSRSSLPARALTSAFPQGWAFFTRSPQEEQMHAYTDTKPLRPLDRAPYAEPRNAFGLDRAVRMQTAELAAIVAMLRDADWSPCSSEADCMTAVGVAKPVDNPVQHPSYCGAVIVIARNIVPWGYRELVPDTFRNARAIRLQVRCLH